jgi:opacity protein-like surface antigen
LDGNEFLLTGTAGYRFDGFSNGSTIEVLGGVRCVWNKSKVEVDGMGSNRDTSDLVDGIVMVRPSLPLSVIWEKLENLRLNPTFSIGAGESDLVWEVQPELQYQFSDRVAARAGYRRLQYKFSDGPADVDVGFQGFLVGFGVTL